jgi:hypothetical protein
VAIKLDGAPAAATTVNRKRAVLSNALRFAVEVGLLASNPVESIKWRAPKATRAVDRRSVVNPLCKSICGDSGWTTRGMYSP